MSNTYYLSHHGIKGQKWGVRRFRNSDGTLTEEGKKRASYREKRNQKKIEKAEQYLGRKLQVNDGFSKNGSDITKKGLKKVKEWDDQEKRYKAVRKKGDPSYDYVRSLNLKYHTSLSVKDVDRIIKKMDKNSSLDVLSEVQKQQAIKAGKKSVARAMINLAPMAVTAAYSLYYNNRR